MAKVYLICGKICSGKSYYSKQLKEKFTLKPINLIMVNKIVLG